MARDQRSENAPRGAPTLQDHWHSAYNVYVCDTVSPTAYPDDSGEDLTGIHSHGDGLIHIHPFVSTVSAQFATLGAYFREIEVEFNDSTIGLPNGTVLSEDDFTCGEGDDAVPAEVRVLKWNTLAAETPIVFTENLEDVRLNENGQLFVFAIGDSSTDDDDIPRPDDAFLREWIGRPVEERPIGEGDGGTGPILPDAEDGTDTGDDGTGSDDGGSDSTGE